MSEEDGNQDVDNGSEGAPVDARAEIDRLKGDEGFRAAYLDGAHPEHKAAVERFTSLHKAVANGVAAEPETTFRGGLSLGTEAPKDSQAARAEIERLKQDADFQKAFLDKSHPQHQAAIDRMTALHAAAPTADDATAIGPDLLKSPDDFAAHLQNAFIELDDNLEDVQYGKETVATWMADLGLADHESKILVEAYNGSMRKGEARFDDAAIDSAQTEARGALRGLWGDKYADNFAAAQRAVKRLDKGEGEVVHFLEESGIGDDPWVISTLAKAAIRNNW